MTLLPTLGTLCLLLGCLVQSPNEDFFVCLIVFCFVEFRFWFLEASSFLMGDGRGLDLGEKGGGGGEGGGVEGKWW